MHLDIAQNQEIFRKQTISDAIWEYVKHLYPPLTKGVKFEIFYEFQGIDLRKMNTGISFEYTDAVKIVLPQYENKKIHDRYIFDEKDLDALLLNYWRVKNKSLSACVGEQYSYQIRFTYETQGYFERNNGTGRFSMSISERNLGQELLGRILADVERVHRTGGAPIEY